MVFSSCVFKLVEIPQNEILRLDTAEFTPRDLRSFFDLVIRTHLTNESNMERLPLESVLHKFHEHWNHSIEGPDKRM